MIYYKVVIIYNRLIEESLSCSSLKGQRNVIIFDNSREEFIYNNKMISEYYGFEYITYHSNIGISRAYNKVIEYIKKSTTEYYVSWFDDDTIISEEYFKAMKIHIQNGTYDLLAPIVKDNEGILSPSYMLMGFYPRRLRNFNVKKKNLTAINSGLCVSWKVYQKVNYNEQLFLDYVDHVFINNAKNEGFSIHIVNTVITQNFSETTKNEIEQIKSRFEIYSKDFLNAYRKVIAKIFLLIRAIKRSFKYKTFSFIEIVWRNLK